MGMTITEKILARAGGLQKVAPGDVAVVDVETACLLDLSFLPEGWRKVLKVADPSKVVIIFDHLVPAPTGAGRRVHEDRARVRQGVRHRAPS
jgi:3-isopropylmalate/(R)-2-methylmalate dehydratase large subunit